MKFTDRLEGCTVWRFLCILISNTGICNKRFFQGLLVCIVCTDYIFLGQQRDHRRYGLYQLMVPFRRCTNIFRILKSTELGEKTCATITCRCVPNTHSRMTPIPVVLSAVGARRG